MPVVTFKFDLNFNQTINCVGNFEGKKKQGVDIDWAHSNFTAYLTCGAIVEATFGPHFFENTLTMIFCI